MIYVEDLVLIATSVEYKDLFTEIKESFTCEDCRIKYFSSFQIKKVFRSTNLKCAFCGVSSTNLDQLVNHLREHLYNLKTFKQFFCENCLTKSTNTETKSPSNTSHNRNKRIKKEPKNKPKKINASTLENEEESGLAIVILNDNGERQLIQPEIYFTGDNEEQKHTSLLDQIVLQDDGCEQINLNYFDQNVVPSLIEIQNEGSNESNLDGILGNDVNEKVVHSMNQELYNCDILVQNETQDYSSSVETDISVYNSVPNISSCTDFPNEVSNVEFILEPVQSESPSEIIFVNTEPSTISKTSEPLDLNILTSEGNVTIDDILNFDDSNDEFSEQIRLETEDRRVVSQEDKQYESVIDDIRLKHYCRTCNKAVLAEHLRKIFLSNINYCARCCASFQKDEEFYDHIRLHFSGNDYQCLNCHDRGYYDVKTKRDKNYTCKSCKNEFMGYQSFSLHTCFPAARRKKCTKCIHCKKSILRTSLHLHIQKEHTTATCEVCNTEFIRNNRISIKCDHCQAILHNEECLVQHLDAKHESVTFVCTYCPKKFYTLKMLHKHLNRHDVSLNIERDKPKEHVFPSIQIAIKKHKEIAEERKITKEEEQFCQFCFANVKFLKGHLLYSHVTSCAKCEICNREFKKMVSYTNHLKKHED